MSDDLVKQAMAELTDVVRCRCNEAYTGRGLHDPDCQCDSAEAVKVVTDRIEELELAVRYEVDLAQQALDARKELEAKLAADRTEVIALIRKDAEIGHISHGAAQWVIDSILAEPKGQDDE